MAKDKLDDRFKNMGQYYGDISRLSDNPASGVSSKRLRDDDKKIKNRRRRNYSPRSIMLAIRNLFGGD